MSDSPSVPQRTRFSISISHELDTFPGVMDSKLKDLLANFTSNESWRGKCVEKLQEAVVDNGAQSRVMASLVGEDGVRGVAQNGTTWEAEQVWGVDINTCWEYCGRSKFPMVFNYQEFLARATNYLLPWLALTAQLPYEGGSAKANIMSFCMSLGSPALATYSLMITILNQNWLRRLCESLPKFEDGENQIQNPYTKRMSSARILLEAAQQAPLQISDTDGSLSSLVILEANNSWWNSVEQRLRATKRNVTISLVAQMLVAAGAWVLTVAGSFLASLGDHNEALVLSSSALWTWLVSRQSNSLRYGEVNHQAPQVPVIWGWIAVGTQSSSDTIDDTLSEFVVVRAGQRDNVPPHKTSNQEAFKVLKSLPSEKLPKFFIFNICGDEIQQGPTFNYARVFTWWGAAKATHKTFERVATKYNDRDHLAGQQQAATAASNESRPVASTGAPRVPSTSETRPEQVELQAIRTGPPSNVNAKNILGASRVQSFRMRDLNGTIDQLNQYCGFGSHTRFTRYPSWKEIMEDGDILIRMMVAALVGLLVQWGTTIPAVIIAYLTDVKGVGCRSGSYLVYGIAGTLAFCLLFVSTLFSHAAVLSHNAATVELATRKPPENSGTEEQAEEAARPCPYAGSTIWALLAVSTRMSGQVIAIGNASWIILSSLWELIGFYDSCWCEGTVLSAGEHAWVVLFKQAVDLRERAEGPWAGGVTMSILVCFISWGVFVLLCKDVRER
ncbi:hypothetical protein V8F33_010523 [Rhypophila sp. PSN 637]